MALKKLNGLLRFRRLKIYWWWRLAACGYDVFWPQDRSDVLNVIDLVHAGFDTLNRVHAVGNVARYRHAKLMCLFADRFDDLQFDRAVNLDLLKPGIVILVDDGACFFQCG